MGIFCSSIASSENGMTTNQYLALLCRNAGGTKYITGGGVKKGGYDSLADYGNSMFTQAKEKMIRSIAADVAGILKISPSFAKTASLKDVIDKFAKIVPDPRKNRTIKTDLKIHSDVCKKLGHAINKNYHMDLVDENASSEKICQVVCELLYTLFTGLHSEFFTVSADVSRIVKNLTVLQEYVDGINKQMISKGTDSMLKETYDALSQEISRQHAYLTNLTSNVIGPAGNSLINLVDQNKEFPGLTKDLRDAAGTREFSDKLSYMMSGLNSVTHATHLVDKALKTIGMSVSEYKNTKNIKELKNKIYDIMVKNSPSSNELSKLMAAADILYRNDLSHDDIVAQLNKKGGQIRGGEDGLGFASMVSDSLYKKDNGVYTGRVHANKRSLTTELRTKEVLRERLFATLNTKIRNNYNSIISDLYKVGKKIGNDIKISDDLRMFIRQLGYFSGVQPDRKDLHKALSGYRKDVNSQYVKHDFMKSLESIIEACSSDLMKYSEIKSLANSIEHLLNDIDTFNNTFTKALTDVHIDHKSIPKGVESKGGADNDDEYKGDEYKGDEDKGESFGLEDENKDKPEDEDKDDIAGGNYDALIGQFAGAEKMLGGYSSQQIDGAFEFVSGHMYGGSDNDFKYLVTMKKAIREIEYYFKIANIKYNLSVAASQNKDYSKDYENILGEECGIMIDKINKKFKFLTCEDDTGNDPLNTTGVDRAHSCVYCS
jgi:hypothetical protein